MRDHGWIEGKNLIADYRSAEGHAERVAPLANELVALKPDVLVGPSPQEALGGVDTYRIHKMIAARVTTAR